MAKSSFGQSRTTSGASWYDSCLLQPLSLTVMQFTAASACQPSLQQHTLLPCILQVPIAVMEGSSKAACWLNCYLDAPAQAVHHAVLSKGFC